MVSAIAVPGRIEDQNGCARSCRKNYAQHSARDVVSGDGELLGFTGEIQVMSRHSVSAWALTRNKTAVG